MTTEVTQLLQLQDLLIDVDENLEMPLEWKDPDRLMHVIDVRRGTRCQMRYQNSTINQSRRVAVFEGDNLGWAQVDAEDIDSQFHVLQRWYRRCVASTVAKR